MFIGIVLTYCAVLLQTSELSFSEQQVVREAIDRPEAVLLVRLKHVSEISDSDTTTEHELAVANVHVTWSLLKYPALQALQVRQTSGRPNDRMIAVLAYTSAEEGGYVRNS